eukprot:1938500-Heterocapsa_arctica.AAC.1
MGCAVEPTCSSKAVTPAAFSYSALKPCTLKPDRFHPLEPTCSSTTVTPGGAFNSSALKPCTLKPERFNPCAVEPTCISKAVPPAPSAPPR